MPAENRIQLPLISTSKTYKGTRRRRHLTLLSSSFCHCDAVRSACVLGNKLLKEPSVGEQTERAVTPREHQQFCLYQNSSSLILQICLNRRCQNTSVFGVHKCAMKCHGRGVSTTGTFLLQSVNKCWTRNHFM